MQGDGNPGGLGTQRAWENGRPKTLIHAPAKPRACENPPPLRGAHWREPLQVQGSTRSGVQSKTPEIELHELEYQYFVYFVFLISFTSSTP